MYIRSFEWDQHNINHIAAHHIEPFEVEEVFQARTFRRSHSGRYVAYGQTHAGRYLTAVFELKPDNVARPVTAREMTQWERRYFNERRGE